MCKYGKVCKERTNTRVFNRTKEYAGIFIMHPVCVKNEVINYYNILITFMFYVCVSACAYKA